MNLGNMGEIVGRNEFYSVHGKSEVPQNIHMAKFHGNWPCKSEALERPKLEGDKRQLPVPRKYMVPERHSGGQR